MINKERIKENHEPNLTVKERYSREKSRFTNQFKPVHASLVAQTRNHVAV